MVKRLNYQNDGLPIISVCWPIPRFTDQQSNPELYEQCVGVHDMYRTDSAELDVHDSVYQGICSNTTIRRG